MALQADPTQELAWLDGLTDLHRQAVNGSGVPDTFGSSAIPFQQYQSVAHRAEALSNWSTLYPNLDPAVAYSFASGGLDPYSPEGQQTAEATLTSSVNSGLGQFQPGQRVTAAQLGPQVLSDVLGKVDTMLQKLQPVVDVGNQYSSAKAALQQQFVADLKAPGANGSQVYKEYEQKAKQYGLDRMDIIAPPGPGGGGNPFMSASEGKVFDVASKGVSMALSAPYQELQGQERNLIGTIAGTQHGPWLRTQSDLGVTISNFFHDRPVDTATVAQDLQRRQLESGNVGGHVITVGRVEATQGVGPQHWLAQEPGTRAYSAVSGLVDAGLAMTTDPTNIGFKKLGTVHTASTSFVNDAGGLRGLTDTVDPAKIDAYHNGPDAWRVYQGLTHVHDTLDVWNAFDRKIEPSLARQIAQSTDPQEIKDLVGPHLGTTLGPVTPDVMQLRLQHTNMPRVLSLMPEPRIDYENGYQSVSQVERLLKSVNAPDATIHEMVDKMAGADTVATRRNVYRNDVVGGTVRGILVDNGVTPENARILTTIRNEVDAHSQHYLTDLIGNDMNPWPNDPVVAGEAINQPSPYIQAQTASSDPMLNVRELRDGLRKYRQLLNKTITVGKLAPVDTTGLSVDEIAQKIAQQPPQYMTAGQRALAGGAEAVHMTYDAALALQENLWKPAVLMRVALPVRIIAEAQAAMAAGGMDSLFNHPLKVIAGIISNAGDKTFMLQNFDEVNTFRDRLMRGAAFKDPTRQKTLPGFVPVANTEEYATEYNRARARELILQHVDPDARKFAQLPTLKDKQDWYWNNSKGRTDWMGEHPELGIRSNGVTWQPGMKIGSADNYVEMVDWKLQHLTGGEQALIDAVATGKLGDAPLWISGKGPVPGGMDARFVRALEDYRASGPAKVIGEAHLAEQTGLAERWNHATDRVFGLILAKPANALAYGPVYKQAYFAKGLEMFPLASEDAQREIIANAGKANMPASYIAKLEQAAKVGAGDLTAPEMDHVAHFHAVEQVKTVLHDLNDRSQLFDQLRLLAPFGDAWRLIIKRWAGLVKSNPGVLRTGQKVWGALTSPDVGAFLGEPAGQGFFHRDTKTGQMVFTYPGSQWLNAKATGVPVPLVASVQGLSIGTEVMPGLGPVAQIPTAYFYDKLGPKGPVGETIKNTLFPFGEPSGWLDVLHTWAPAWTNKIAAGASLIDPGLGRAIGGVNADSVAMMARVQMAVYDYKVSRGEVNINDPASIQKGMDEAAKQAGGLYLIRGLAQFSVPSAPTWEFMVQDKHGGLADAGMIADDYRAMQNDPTVADPEQTFLDKYGPDLASLMQSKSYAVIFGAPTTKDGAEWASTNKTVVKAYPHIYGYFAPQTGTFDYATYLAQFHNGTRATLTPDQYTKLSNARIAGLQYQHAHDLVSEANKGKPPTPEQAAALRAVKEALYNQYPGYREAEANGLGLPSRADPSLLIHEAEVAATDPKILATDAGKGLALYMELRDQALKVAASRGYKTFATGEGTADLRAILRFGASAIGAQYKDFNTLFESVLDNEMASDIGDQTVPQQAAG